MCEEVGELDALFLLPTYFPNSHLDPVCAVGLPSQYGLIGIFRASMVQQLHKKHNKALAERLSQIKRFILSTYSTGQAVCWILLLVHSGLYYLLTIAALLMTHVVHSSARPRLQRCAAKRC